MRDVNLGPVSAYALAVKYGYEGTEEEWVKEQEAAREEAVASAKSAENSAGEARESAAAASSSASAASASAGQAQSAKIDAASSASSAQAAQTFAESAAGQAAQSAQAAASSAESAQQSASSAASEADKAESLTAKMPIVQDGVWWVYSPEQEEYVSTGQPAQGPQGPAGTPGMPEEDVLAAIKTEADKKADAIWETVGPAAVAATDMASVGSLLRPVSEIKLVQEGEGEPSFDNIRNISGWDSITLTHNDESTAQAVPETVYGGSYDWAKGELTVMHKFFSLAINKMNNEEKFPGWHSVDGLLECIRPNFNDKIKNVVVNIGTHINVNTNYGSNTIFLAYGITESELKAKYPDIVCQIVLPLLEPKTIQLTPHEFRALSGTNTLSSDCGNTTVTFSADLKKYIDKKLAELTRGG